MGLKVKKGPFHVTAPAWQLVWRPDFKENAIAATWWRNDEGFVMDFRPTRGQSLREWASEIVSQFGTWPGVTVRSFRFVPGRGVAEDRPKHLRCTLYATQEGERLLIAYGCQDLRGAFYPADA